MTIAERWADIPAGCVCRWTARDGGWVLAVPHGNCPAAHEEET